MLDTEFLANTLEETARMIRVVRDLDVSEQDKAYTYKSVATLLRTIATNLDNRSFYTTVLKTIHQVSPAIFDRILAATKARLKQEKGIV